MEVEESPTSVQMPVTTPEKKPVSGELVKIKEVFMFIIRFIKRPVSSHTVLKPCYVS